MTDPVLSYVPNGLTILWDFKRKHARGKAEIFISSLNAVVLLCLGGSGRFGPQRTFGNVRRHF